MNNEVNEVFLMHEFVHVTYLRKYKKKTAKKPKLLQTLFEWTWQNYNYKSERSKFSNVLPDEI